MTGTRLGHGTVFVQAFSIHDGVAYAARRHDHTLGATRQVEAPFTPIAGADGGRIENGDVGRETEGQSSSISDTEEIRRVAASG